MNTPEILSIVAATVAVVAGGVALVRGIAKSAAPRPLTVKRKDSNKSVTLPAHYTPNAVRELLDLVS